jgi:malic enzyme
MNFCVKVDPSTSQPYLSTSLKGKALLMDPFTNKGTAFTARERDELDLHGLLPPAVCTVEQQLERVYENFQAKSTPLEQFIYLASLHDRNETLFFRLVHERIDEMLPIVYTPVVGEACQRYSHIYRRGRGLYVSYDQRDHIEKVLSNYHTTDPSVLVVTDGERILGLGDQGVGGMGIPIGKLCLYTLCAGVSPYNTLPIMLDVGTDNEERLRDRLYLGLRHKRVRGDDYQAFVDRFVDAVRRVYPHVLLQWEDFLKANAITQLQRFRDRGATFNDDIQGTAAVVLSGIYCGLKLTGQSIRDQRLLFAGAGASAQGIADLFVAALMEGGLPIHEARRRIWTVDTKGLVARDRRGLEDLEVEPEGRWLRASATNVPNLSRRSSMPETREQRAALKAQRAEVKERARLYVESRIAEAAKETDRVENEVARLHTLLADALPVYHAIDFETLKDTAKIPPFDPGPLALAEEMPALERYLPRPLSLLHRLIPGAQRRHAEETAAAHQRYEADLGAHPQREAARLAQSC